LGRGQPVPSISARGSGERCKLSQRGPGRSPARLNGFLHFIDARWLFLASHYIAKNFLLNISGGWTRTPLKYVPAAFSWFSTFAGSTNRTEMQSFTESKRCQQSCIITVWFHAVTVVCTHRPSVLIVITKCLVLYCTPSQLQILHVTPIVFLFNF